MALRADKESIDVLLGRELESDAVVDQVDKPEPVLLGNLVGVLVGDDAIDTSPGKESQAKGASTSELLPSSIRGQGLHQVEDSRGNSRSPAISLMKTVGRVVGLDRPPCRFHQNPTPQRKWLPYLQICDPDS